VDRDGSVPGPGDRITGHGRESRRYLLAWLTHPLTVTALVVLVLNDHILKTVAPGFVTGKLSDVAGLILTPPVAATVAALVLPRVPVDALAKIVTLGLAAAFTVTKTTAAGAATATAIWSQAWDRPSPVLRDPTDLIALPALGAAWWAFHRARRAPMPDRIAAWAPATLTLPVSILALLASSAMTYPAAIDVISLPGAAIVVLQDPLTDGRPPEGIITSDGRTWSDVNSLRSVSLSRGSANAADRARGTCMPGEPARCYRPAPGRLAVEESEDGGRTWRTAWSISLSRQRFLARAYPGTDKGAADVAAQAVGVFRSRSGPVVVAADNRDGVLVRRSDGSWQRVGFPTVASAWLTQGPVPAPPPLTAAGQRLAPEYLWAALAASLGLFLGGAGARRRLRGALGGVTASTLLLIIGIGGLFLVGAMTGPPATVEMLAVGLLAWAVLAVSTEALTAGRAAVLVALASVSVAVTMRPMVKWSAGSIDSYDAAARAMVVSAVAGVAVVAAAGVLLGRRPDDSPAPPPRPQIPWG